MNEKPKPGIRFKRTVQLCKTLAAQWGREWSAALLAVFLLMGAALFCVYCKHQLKVLRDLYSDDASRARAPHLPRTR